MESAPIDEPITDTGEKTTLGGSDSTDDIGNAIDSRTALIPTSCCEDQKEHATLNTERSAPSNSHIIGDNGVVTDSESELIKDEENPSTPKRFLPHSVMTSTMSSNSSDIFPICRICSQPGIPRDPLFTPCRCSGTMQYIHHSCLLKWIIKSTSQNSPKCEICFYTYNRHKKFEFQNCSFPTVSRRDKCLHIVFIFNLIIMLGCATATIMCFLSDKGHISKFPKHSLEFTTEEIITLTCGVLFFLSFFLAMSSQIKAKDTLYKVIKQFFMINVSLEIEEYDPTQDSKNSQSHEKTYNFPKLLQTV